MVDYGLAGLAGVLGISVLLLVLVLVWSLVWKGLALWKAGRLNQPVWFVVLLLINTLGILEILYIFVFSKIKNKGKKKRR